MLRLGQSVEGGCLGGHTEWLGRGSGGNVEPQKVLELGRHPGREAKGRPRGVREKRGDGSDGASQMKAQDKGGETKNGELPGSLRQASPTRKGGELAQVQPSRLIWGEGTRGLIWRATRGVSTGQRRASPSPASPRDPTAGEEPRPSACRRQPRVRERNLVTCGLQRG